MASIFWGMNAETAIRAPYEYEAKRAFYKEAIDLLNSVWDLIYENGFIHKVSQNSREKAVWMLLVDALDTLADCIALLSSSNHRLPSRMLRDVCESMNLAEYFFYSTKESDADLDKWFNNEIVDNSRYRDFIKRRDGKEQFEYKRQYYRAVSRISHHTYDSLLYAYSIGANDKLVYERTKTLRVLVLPHTLSMYCALFSDSIMTLLDQMKKCNIVSEEQMDKILHDSFSDGGLPIRYQNI